MKIVKFKDSKRFAISDDNGKIIDDAQGWGYKSIEKAEKAMWWKFGGGKQKHDAIKRWWNQSTSHKKLEKTIHNMIEMNVKELCRGEVTLEDIFMWASSDAEKLGIVDFDYDKFNGID